MAHRETMEDLPRIEDMHRDAVGTKPVDMDWTQGYGETWEFWEGTECEEEGKTVVVSSPNEDDKGHGVIAEGPMMSYWYPLDCITDPEEAAMKISSLPLCVVQVSGKGYGLALTGGGMDLSWEICEAFMRLKHLPPLAFANLPGMAGKPSGAVDEWVIKGCEASARFAEGDASRIMEHLKKMGDAGLDRRLRRE